MNGVCVFSELHIDILFDMLNHKAYEARKASDCC